MGGMGCPTPPPLPVLIGLRWIFARVKNQSILHKPKNRSLEFFFNYKYKKAGIKAL